MPPVNFINRQKPDIQAAVESGFPEDFDPTLRARIAKQITDRVAEWIMSDGWARIMRQSSQAIWERPWNPDPTDEEIADGEAALEKLRQDLEDGRTTDPS